jgi:hypothetical protein
VARSRWTAPTWAASDRPAGGLAEGLPDGLGTLLGPWIGGRSCPRGSGSGWLVLDGGRVAEAGDHAVLAARPGIYANLFTLQAEGYLGR